MTRPIARFVVSMGADGSILSQGSVSDALLKDHLLREKVVEEQEVIAKVQSEVDSPPSIANEQPPDGKLIMAEEIEEGHVSWAARKL